MQGRATVAFLLCLCSDIYGVRAASTVTSTTDVATDATTTTYDSTDVTTDAITTTYDSTDVTTDEALTTPDVPTEATTVSLPGTQPPATSNKPPNITADNAGTTALNDATTDAYTTMVTTAAPVTVCSMENCTFANGSSCTEGDVNCTCIKYDCGPADPEPSGLSTGAIIGIACGGAAAVILVVVVVTVCCCKKKKKNRQVSASQHGSRAKVNETELEEP